MIVIENDIYGPLCYEGEPLAAIKHLDQTGDTILLRSFSKVAFPGLRVGWVIARRALIEELTEAKQWSDLHTDQLSQAVLLRFAESGRLEQHRRRMLVAGGERLQAALEACEQYLPAGAKFTRPRGGMSLVDPVARIARCGRIAAARRTRRSDLFAGPVFRGVAAATERPSHQFRRHDSGGNPLGPGHFRPDFCRGAQSCARYCIAF